MNIQPTSSSAVRTVAGVLLLYGIWVLATYLLEGSRQTLLRPDATALRLLYAIVANLAIGVVGGIWLLRRITRTGLMTVEAAGFGDRRRTALAVLAALVLGVALYALQGAPTWHPVVLVNAFAQVLVVTAAEVVVCWVLIGRITASLALRSHARGNHERRGLLAFASGVAAAAVAFGLYHFAHSPPFNSIDMVLLLTAVGVGTGLFYFASRDVYGTIVFHNFLGVFGVVEALKARDALTAFERINGPLAVMAIATVLLVVAGHVWLSRTKSREAALREPA